MNTEEKILNYMDGTLSENESGELLHSLSVSPEKRVVLEQHIKLRELTSMAQKSLAVPQALESSMAERFPAIASYNRELAGGAAIIEEAARPGFISRMAASLAAFIAQYPVRTGFAVAAASVIAYFSLSTGDNTNGTNTADKVGVNTNQQQQQITQAPTSEAPKNLNQSNMSHQLNESHNSYLNSAVASSPKANIPSHRVRFASHQAISNTNSVKQPDANLNVANSEHNTPENIIKTPPVKTPVANNNMDVADAPNNAATPKDNDTKNENRNENVKTDNVTPAKDIAVATPAKDATPNAALEENNIHGSSEEQNPFKNNHDNSGGFPFALRLYGSIGSSFVNIHENDNTLASRTEEAALIGFDYIASSHWAIGIEGGNAAISQLITQSAMQSSVNGLPSISRVVVNNVVTNGSQFYARAVGHYTVNPYDAFQFEGTVGAGIAFASSNAPLVSGALFIVHDLNQHFGVSAGLAFAGAWTSSNSQNAAAQAVSTGSDPIGYITTNHATGTLFTPSYAVRVGFKFRP